MVEIHKEILLAPRISSAIVVTKPKLSVVYIGFTGSDKTLPAVNNCTAVKEFSISCAIFLIINSVSACEIRLASYKISLKMLSLFWVKSGL